MIVYKWLASSVMPTSTGPLAAATLLQPGSRVMLGRLLVATLAATGTAADPGRSADTAEGAGLYDCPLFA
jgi:hypothetical protein